MTSFQTASPNTYQAPESKSAHEFFGAAVAAHGEEPAKRVVPRSLTWLRSRCGAVTLHQALIEAQPPWLPPGRAAERQMMLPRPTRSFPHVCPRAVRLRTRGAGSGSDAVVGIRPS